MRGRRRIPSQLHVLHGAPGRRPIIKEPEQPGPLYQPPSWLTKDQAEEWHYAINHSAPGLLRALDRGLLTIWAVAADIRFVRPRSDCKRAGSRSGGLVVPLICPLAIC